MKKLVSCFATQGEMMHVKTGEAFRRRNELKGTETNFEEGGNKGHVWETASLLSGWTHKGKKWKLKLARLWKIWTARVRMEVPCGQQEA